MPVPNQFHCTFSCYNPSFSTAFKQQLRKRISIETRGLAQTVGLQMGAHCEHLDLLSEQSLSHKVTIAYHTAQRRSTAPDTKSTLCADVQHLPILTCSVDIIIASNVLECHSKPHDTMHEIQRICSDGGHCILVLSNPWRPRALFSYLFNRVFNRPRNKFLYPGRVIEWFSLMGFENIQLHYMGGSICGWLNEKKGLRHFALFNTSNYLLVFKKNRLSGLHQNKRSKRPAFKRNREPALVQGKHYRTSSQIK